MCLVSYSEEVTHVIPEAVGLPKLCTHVVLAPVTT